MATKNKLEIILVLIFLTIFFLPSIGGLALNYLWYDSLGYAEVFLVKYKAALLLFGLSFLLTGSILYLVSRSGISTIMKTGGPITSLWESEFFAGIDKEYIEVTPEKNISAALKAIQLPVLLFIILFSGMQALAVSGSWLKILMYLNRTPFGQVDPIFNNDVAFYVFSLPFYSTVLNYASAILFLGMLLLAGLYATFNWKLLMQLPTDLRVLLAGFLIIFATKTYLGRYDILYSETGVVYGAGYIDVAIRQYIPVILALVFLFTAVAVLLSGGPSLPSVPKILVGMVGAMVLISVLGGVTASLIQDLKVLPNELELERPYIMNNIHSTNTAYKLDEVEVRQYPLTYNLSLDILEHPSITNARIWDYRPLLTIYKQKQAIRTYYGFNDVDVDRYNINGTTTQVWLSPREIFYDQLQGKADTWLNKHVLYTHGIGLVMSPVNMIVDQGLPEMYIENIPPVSSLPALTIEEPRIYYGEKTDSYIITGTGREEFDYPSGNTNMLTTYTGTGGISMGGLNKFFTTLALSDLKILMSPDIGADSKLHINRNVMERAELITPYLLLDRDAYVVLGDDGHIYWIINGFTTTDRYPYSEPLWIGNTKLNYIQDSTKAVVDAYNGTITYYVIEDDPVLNTYSKIFPGVFKPMDQMPADIKSHMRYSPDLFMIQSKIYTDYHMKVPEVFYNREDRWQFAKEKYGTSQIQVEPYNVLLELDGSTNFYMIMPFTPSNKDNMISWMAVNQDQPEYGQKIVYEFSKDKLIYGPAQIEALIDQDEDISKDLTLWSSGGSNVIRGNLLVIPIEDSLLYIEPLYISAESASSIPELKKILVIYENRVVMEDSLEEALAELMGANVTTVTPLPGFPDMPDVEGKNLNELLDETLAHYEIARVYLEAGDLENYGREMKIVDSLMEQLGLMVEETLD
ncbi:MAG: UPF0182 family protein [Methanosarcinales archaeon]|nr:UPF0182 family protein [Methanosarcinales archaeon]